MHLLKFSLSLILSFNKSLFGFLRDDKRIYVCIYIRIYACKKYYLFALATLSNSSFFLIAYEFELPFAAFTNSSAKHSAIVLTFLNAASLAPVVNK